MTERKLTNKQLIVLAVLREHGPMTCNDISDVITKQTTCSACGGTGDGDDPRFGCKPCYGRGYVFFHYSVAYQCLKRLRSLGLVTRRFVRDEWGDEIPRHIYEAADSSTRSDELEKLWDLPTAARQ